MAISAYDAQVFMWKMLKFSTTTCVHVSKKHPYVTSCLFFLSILYIYFPIFFWILIYSLPLAVSTWVVLSIRDSRRCKDESEIEREIERELKERESGGKLHKQTKFATKDSVEKGKGKKIKKAFSRVHSVRRRRAKEIACGDDSTPEGKSRVFEFNGDHDVTDDDDEMEEEKHALLSTDSNTDRVDRTTMVDGSPKEIHEVGKDFLLASTHVGPDVSIDHEIYHNPEIDRSLKLLKDEGDARDEAGKAMDVNIAEDETNKRLESLIARRRSQKMINPPVKKSLVNLDHATFGSGSGSGPQMPPIVIPKINTWCSPSKVSGPFSPGPGSAPSVLIPMRNPFDLPYDPQEEKLDLTGDSFQQEFASGHMPRDFTFCRHESFSLGPSLPMDFFEDRDDTSSVDDFGFRRRRSSYGFQFSKPETEESDTDFGATTEAESGAESETKSNIDSPNSDQIKEVIQVHENGTQSHSAEEARVGPSKHNTRRNALDELSLSSNSSSTGSTGSSEDERPPICKINREAILKSLSMRRNSVSVPDIEMEGNEQLQENNLSYANSALENASRLKQQYFADKPQKRHGMTFSIASDMQVEVSEMSSPPLTIGENMSYQDDASAYDTELERNTSWDGLDSWAGSSRLSESRLSEIEDNEMRLTRANEAGASRSRKYDDTSLSRSLDTEKHCITSSSSASELSESQASDLHEKVAQTTSPETNVGEEPPASEDAKVASFEATIENNVQTNEPAQRVEGEHETSSNQAAMDSTSPPQERPAERVHHATISPKSVLQPTLSVASFEHEGDDEARLSAAHPAEHSSSNAPQNSIPLVVQFTVGTSSNGVAEAPQQNNQGNDEKQKEVIVGSSSKMMQIHENSAQTMDISSPSRSLTSNVNTNDTEFVNGKMKIQENDDHLKEDAGGSTSKALEINEASPKTREESSSRSLKEAEIYPISSLSNENETTIRESTHSEVEDKDTYESHMTNEADEEAQQRANS